MRLVSSIREFLFGYQPRHGGQARKVGTALIHQIAHGGLRDLDVDRLMELVDFLLTTPQLRRPLRGNTRFLGSVAARYHRNRQLTQRQIQAIYNILERAYPHNLAAELRRFI